MDFIKNIPLIERKINYTFKDKSLLMQAFTRTSFCNERNYKGKESYSSNEVLEFFGDSVLSCAIISLLLERKTERYAHGIKTALTEGELSAIRSKLSDKRHLSSRTAQLGLQRFLLLGEGDEKLGIADEASVMEDLFESIIGAIYIDSGMDIKVVIDVVSKLIDLTVYADGEAPIQSYKNALQEWCASKKHRLPPPVYKTLSESGPEHKRVFERGCYVGERLVGVGTGKNQKEADTAAAKEAFDLLSREIAEGSVKEDALNELRILLASNKAPSAEFHDLGELPIAREGERRFVVECTALGISASGTGYSKRDARAEAASKVLFEIKNKNSDKKSEAKPKKTKGRKIPTQKSSSEKVLGESKSSSPSTKEAKLQAAPKRNEAQITKKLKSPEQKDNVHRNAKKPKSHEQKSKEKAPVAKHRKLSAKDERRFLAKPKQR